jgi:hypothetical protein
VGDGTRDDCCCARFIVLWRVSWYGFNVVGAVVVVVVNVMVDGGCGNGKSSKRCSGAARGSHAYKYGLLQVRASISDSLRLQ